MPRDRSDRFDRCCGIGESAKDGRCGVLVDVCLLDLDAEVDVAVRGLPCPADVAAAPESDATGSKGGLVDEDWCLRWGGGAGTDLTRPCDRVCFSRCNAAAVLGISAMHCAGLAGAWAPAVMSASGMVGLVLSDGSRDERAGVARLDVCMSMLLDFDGTCACRRCLLGVAALTRVVGVCFKCAGGAGGAGYTAGEGAVALNGDSKKSALAVAQGV